jgi:alkylation response protein AidB-like acyl-CoA dehydrogenase
MRIELTPLQSQAQKTFRAFVDEKIVPFADRNDQEERLPAESIENLAAAGYLGAAIPEESGGRGLDMITLGLMCEEIGRGSASLLSLITVQGMVSVAILKWGSSSQRAYWLPRLASGKRIAAFGLTEPNVGSDAKSVETLAEFSDGSYVLYGTKKWISFGQIADLFLIIAQCEGKPVALLVERNSPGFRIEAIRGMLGFRSSMLAELHMEKCLVPEENLLGKVGFGFSHVAATALDYGRYCIACGCVGLAQACLDACLAYTSARKQGGIYLKGYQLIQQMITEMVTNIKAARLLCYSAGYLKDNGKPESIVETSIAKYFASRIVNKVASDAVQIHGANGCSSKYPVQRYMRDAKIMEIIEGSTQVHQILISTNAYQNYKLSTSYDAVLQ